MSEGPIVPGEKIQFYKNAADAVMNRAWSPNELAEALHESSSTFLELSKRVHDAAEAGETGHTADSEAAFDELINLGLLSAKMSDVIEALIEKHVVTRVVKEDLPDAQA